MRILEELNDAHTNNERIKAIIDDAAQECRLPEMAVIAELSIHNGNFDLASQICMHIIVRSRLSDLSETRFIEELSHLISQAKQTDVKFSSAVEFLSHCFHHMRYALGQNGLLKVKQDAWIGEAVNALCLWDAATAEAYARNKHTLHEWQGQWSPDFRREFKCFYPDDLQNPIACKGKKRFQSSYPLAMLITSAVILLSCIVFLMYAKVIFQDRDGTALHDTFMASRETMILWVMLSIVTWVYAAISSSILGCLSYVSPYLFMIKPEVIIKKPKIITHGEIISFNQDTFFTIFQFIWVPFAAITIILFEKADRLAANIRELCKDLPTCDATKFQKSINATTGFPLIGGENVIATLKALLLNDTTVLACAALIAGISIVNQVRIQRLRIKTKTTFSWFDWRVSKAEWFVRLTMVGVDMFLCTFFVLKILGLATICAELAGSDLLRIRYFSPDGAGGIKFLNDIFMNFSWLIILLGFFVMASLYAHRKMEGYLTSDLIVVSIYCILVVLSVAPFFVMEYKLDHEQRRLIASICNSSFSSICNAHLTNYNISDIVKSNNIANYVRDVSAIKEWKVSVINSGTWGSLLSMISQAVIIIIQYALKAKGGAVPEGIASRLPLGRANNLTSRLP